MSHCEAIGRLLLLQERLQCFLSRIVINLTWRRGGRPPIVRPCRLLFLHDDEGELIEKFGIVDIHLLRGRLRVPLDHPLHHGRLVPDQVYTDLHNAALTLGFHAMDGENVLDIERVAVRNVSGSINARNANVSCTVLNDSICFHGGGRLDKLTINLEIGLNGSNFVDIFPLIDPLLGRLGLLPARHHHIFRPLTRVKFVKRVSGIVGQKRLEEVGGGEADLAVEHLDVGLL